MSKLLSIIVPSYNMEKYLPKCLGSLVVAAELMEKLEVLVVNDGSKDRTSEIAHEFAAKYPGTFKVIDKPNGNYGSCINAALPVASGEYVKILDADDYFDTKVFEEFLGFLAKQGGEGQITPDVIYSHYCEVDSSGHTTHQPLLVRLGEGGANNHQPLTYRTQFLRDIGYRQTEGIHYTDTEWAVIPMAAVKGSACFDRELYCYRVGREGQSVSPDVWERNIGQVVQVAMRVLHCAQNGAQEQVGYQLLRTVYTACIAAGDRRRISFDLRQLDQQLAAEFPEIYERLANERYTNKCRVGFVKAWRRNTPLDQLRIATCRAYSAAIRWCHVIKQV